MQDEEEGEGVGVNMVEVVCKHNLVVNQRGRTSSKLVCQKNLHFPATQTLHVLAIYLRRVLLFHGGLLVFC